jgi:hypothetical protein
VILLDVPGGTYWTSWAAFVEGELERAGLISADDHELYLVTDNVQDGVEEIVRFWRSYHSVRWVGDLLVLRLRHEPTDQEVAELDGAFRDLLVGGHIERRGPLPAEVSDQDELDRPRLVMQYDPRQAGRLRALIDAANELPSASA